MRRFALSSVILLVLSSVLVAGCADGDNPVALASLDVVAEFEDPGHVHMMESSEIHVRLQGGGGPIHMHDGVLEIAPPGGAAARLVPLEEAGDGFAAHVRFYAPGEHHLHVIGRPEGHHLMREMGEYEVHAVRGHLVADGHRFELETSPAPLTAGGLGLIRVFAFELEEDGSKGAEAEGLELHGALHLPLGLELPVAFTESGHGEYVAQIAVPVSGTYGLQVGLENEEGHGEEEEDEGGDHAELAIHVPPLAGEQAPDDGQEEDNGHGH